MSMNRNARDAVQHQQLSTVDEDDEGDRGARVVVDGGSNNRFASSSSSPNHSRVPQQALSSSELDDQNDDDNEFLDQLETELELTEPSPSSKSNNRSRPTNIDLQRQAIAALGGAEADLDSSGSSTSSSSLSSSSSSGMQPMTIASEHARDSTSGILHSRILCFLAGVLFLTVSIFAAVYFLTDGQGVEIVWPSGGNDGGNNNHDNSGSSSPTGSIATERFDVQINLYEGERYFFNVTESGQTERFRAIETVFSEYNATQEKVTRKTHWNESSTSSHISSAAYEIEKTCGSARWSYLRVKLADYNLTLQDNGQMDTRVVMFSGSKNSLLADSSVAQSSSARRRLLAAPADTNSSSSSLPTTSPSTTPKATEPPPPPYSTSEIKAEFARQLSSFLVGHTFSAKLAHEGTVYKRDSTNIQATLYHAFEMFSKTIVERLFGNLPSLFKTWRTRVQNDVRTKLQSAGSSITNQMQESVYQYLQSHNRHIRVGQTWKRQLDLGAAELNVTYTLMKHIPSGQDGDLSPPIVLDDKRVAWSNGTEIDNYDELIPTFAPRMLLPILGRLLFPGNKFPLQPLPLPTSAVSTHSVNADKKAETLSLSPSRSQNQASSKTAKSSESSSWMPNFNFIKIVRESDSDYYGDDDIPEDAIISSTLANGTGVHSTIDPYNLIAPRVDCEPSEHYAQSARAHAGGYFVVRLRASPSYADELKLQQQDSSSSSTKPTTTPSSECAMANTQVLTTPEEVLSVFDVEKLVPSYAQAIQSGRVEVVNASAVIELHGMLVISESTGVVVGGEIATSSNVTLRLKLARRRRTGQRLTPARMSRGAQSVERNRNAHAELSSYHDEAEVNSDAVQYEPIVLKTEQEVLEYLKSEQIEESIDESQSIEQHGDHIVNHLLSDFTPPTATAARPSLSSVSLQQQQSSTPQPPPSRPRIIRYIVGDTFVSISVKSNSRERVNGEVLVECDNERF